MAATARPVLPVKITPGLKGIAVKNIVPTCAAMATAAALACLTACTSSSHRQTAFDASHGLDETANVATERTPLDHTHLPLHRVPCRRSPTPARCSPEAKAEKAAGVPLTKGEDTRAAGPEEVASCTYNAPPTGQSGSITVFAGLQTPDELTTDRNLGHKLRKVPGLGDQALQETLPSTVFVQTHGVWITISSAYSANPAAMLTAARKATARVA